MARSCGIEPGGMFRARLSKVNHDSLAKAARALGTLTAISGACPWPSFHHDQGRRNTWPMQTITTHTADSTRVAQGGQERRDHIYREFEKAGLKGAPCAGSVESSLVQGRTTTNSACIMGKNINGRLPVIHCWSWGQPVPWNYKCPAWWNLANVANERVPTGVEGLLVDLLLKHLWLISESRWITMSVGTTSANQQAPVLLVLVSFCCRWMWWF